MLSEKELKQLILKNLSRSLNERIIELNIFNKYTKINIYLYVEKLTSGELEEIISLCNRLVAGYALNQDKVYYNKNCLKFSYEKNFNVSTETLDDIQKNLLKGE